MCSELHHLHVLGHVFIDCNVSIGMGSVYVIHYFATLEVHVYMCIQYPYTCTANFSFCSLR